MAIRIDMEIGETPAKQCCETGVQAGVDYRQTLISMRQKTAEVDLDIIDYHQRRCFIAEHCARLSVSRCLLEEPNLTEWSPQTENNK